MVLGEVARLTSVKMHCWNILVEGLMLRKSRYLCLDLSGEIVSFADMFIAGKNLRLFSHFLARFFLLNENSKGVSAS